MESLTHKKIMEIRAWASKCPLLCSPMSQDRPRVPQDAKVKPPSMPTKQRVWVPKMPRSACNLLRICNPEAMSNDRGPAAEGVAHKICICPAGIGANAYGIRSFGHDGLQFTMISDQDTPILPKKKRLGDPAGGALGFMWEASHPPMLASSEPWIIRAEVRGGNIPGVNPGGCEGQETHTGPKKRRTKSEGKPTSHAQALPLLYSLSNSLNDTNKQRPPTFVPVSA